MTKIVYSGIGWDGRDVYNEEDFLALMHREFTNRDWSQDIIYKNVGRENYYQLQFKDFYLPDDFMFFSLRDWIEYSGAEVIN